MAVDKEQRNNDIIYMASAITWMKQAFSGRSGDVANMVNGLSETFNRILQSYEEEIECLKRVLPADTPFQTGSLPAPVDTAAE